MAQADIAQADRQPKTGYFALGLLLIGLGLLLLAGLLLAGLPVLLLGFGLVAGRRLPRRVMIPLLWGLLAALGLAAFSTGGCTSMPTTSVASQSLSAHPPATCTAAGLHFGGSDAALVAALGVALGAGAVGAGAVGAPGGHIVARRTVRHRTG